MERIKALYDWSALNSLDYAKVVKTSFYIWDTHFKISYLKLYLIGSGTLFLIMTILSYSPFFLPALIIFQISIFLICKTGRHSEDQRFSNWAYMFKSNVITEPFAEISYNAQTGNIHIDHSISPQNSLHCPLYVLDVFDIADRSFIQYRDNYGYQRLLMFNKFVLDDFEKSNDIQFYRLSFDKMQNKLDYKEIMPNIKCDYRNYLSVGIVSILFVAAGIIASLLFRHWTALLCIPILYWIFAKCRQGRTRLLTNFCAPYCCTEYEFYKKLMQSTKSLLYEKQLKSLILFYMAISAYAHGDLCSFKQFMADHSKVHYIKTPLCILLQTQFANLLSAYNSRNSHELGKLVNSFDKYVKQKDMFKMDKVQLIQYIGLTLYRETCGEYSKALNSLKKVKETAVSPKSTVTYGISAILSYYTVSKHLAICVGEPADPLPLELPGDLNINYYLFNTVV